MAELKGEMGWSWGGAAGHTFLSCPKLGEEVLCARVGVQGELSWRELVVGVASALFPKADDLLALIWGN